MSLATIKSGIQSIVKTKPIDVTASRALNTEYRNGAYDKYIIASLALTNPESPANNYIELVTSPTNVLTDPTYQSSVALVNIIGRIDTILSGIVKPYFYYMLITTATAGTTRNVTTWWEIDFN